MKILYIAFACDPYAGSEAQCGWSWPVEMRAYADVSVLTRRQNKHHIEKYMLEHGINDMKVFYFDVPEHINLYYKTGKFYGAYYFLWQKLSGKYIKRLNDSIQFDYIHHVTLGDFRCISPACRLNAKFIFGPVGGAQLTPEPLKEYADENSSAEKIREIINRFIRHWPLYKDALNQADLIFAANQETQNYLKSCLRKADKCLLMTENGMHRAQLPAVLQKQKKDRVVLLWSGRMVARKGLKLLIDILSRVQTKKKFIVRLVGEGPEKSKLERQVLDLGLSEKVHFTGKVPYTMMKEIYQESDVFLFPSLRETTGTVLFEAMAYGIPVITFNQNGAALLIDDTCGCKVDVNQPIEKIKNDFASYICELIDDDDLRLRLGNNAYKRILNNYLWETKCKCFFETYLNNQR